MPLYLEGTLFQRPPNGTTNAAINTTYPNVLQARFFKCSAVYLSLPPKRGHAFFVSSSLLHIRQVNSGRSTPLLCVLLSYFKNEVTERNIYVINKLRNVATAGRALTAVSTTLRNHNQNGGRKFDFPDDVRAFYDPATTMLLCPLTYFFHRCNP